MPLIPKEEMPARRGRSPVGHLRGSRSSRTAPAAQSTWLEGSFTCSVRGSRSARSAITILMTPATPAAAWVCPMFDFTEPSHKGSSSVRA